MLDRQRGWGNLEDKECGIWICSNLVTKKWGHVEYKFCDSTCNLYLALAGILSAGMQGIRNGWSLRPALGSPGDEAATATEGLPGSVTEALDTFELDHMLMGLLAADGLGKGHVALRRNEAERMQKMSLD
jgi:glutamine synthetase